MIKEKCVVAEMPVRENHNIEEINMNMNTDFVVAETPVEENKNLSGNDCLTDADMTIMPEKYSEHFGFAQMLVSEDGYNFVRQIHCTVNSVSENHAEGHFLVAWTCDDGPCLMKMELDSDFIYDGEIKDGFPYGTGTMRFINGTSDSLSVTGEPEKIGKGWNYTGSFVYGIPHGFGEMSGPVGKVVKGSFQSGLITEGEIFERSGEENTVVLRRKGKFYHGHTFAILLPRLHFFPCGNIYFDDCLFYPRSE